MQSGPRQEGTVCSARGWIEHRTHLQEYAGPIRSAWLLGGTRASNGAPWHSIARPIFHRRRELAACCLLLASEYSLESAPPFSSFQRPRTLDPLDPKQTKLLRQRCEVATRLSFCETESHEQQCTGQRIWKSGQSAWRAAGSPAKAASQAKRKRRREGRQGERPDS